jgi:ABC-2 type transport system permease protein
MLRTFGSLVQTELRLFFREPVGVFFNLLFPVLLLAVMGPIFGNEASAMFSGYGSVDVFMPAFVGLMIGSFSLIGLPVTLAGYREQGVLRRLRATPVPPLLLLGAQAVVGLVVVVLGTGFLLGVAALAFPLRMPGAPLALVPALVFATLTFMALGFVLGSLLRTTRTAQAVGNALFFPMLFLSGAAMPRALFPGWMRQIGDALPLTYVVTLLQDLYLGQGWNGTALLVLGAVAVTSAAAAATLFRWS